MGSDKLYSRMKAVCSPYITALENGLYFSSKHRETQWKVLRKTYDNSDVIFSRTDL